MGQAAQIVQETPVITTPLTRLLDIRHPLLLGPMAVVAGGQLAAAVSNAGGFGLVGGGYGQTEWLQRELALVAAQTTRPWGAGLITWSATPEKLRILLDARPTAILLSFGDPRPFAPAIKAAGCKLLCQVQDLAGATLACEAGADVIVAQGTEGGGHGGKRSSLPFIPAVVDAVGSIPVVAAGGIADGRGLAAVLALGAQGAMLGTRFYASREAVGTEAAKAFIATRSGDDTRRTSVFDVARGYAWPEGVTGRAIRNPFVERWHGREQALADDERERKAFLESVKNNDYDASMVWAGEDIDLIRSIDPASVIVDRIVAQAEEAIAKVVHLAH